jgi:hypothetical protein
MKLLRDPLLHFLLLGAVIFGVYGLVSQRNHDKPGEIVVARGTVETLIIGFTRTWQRPPTDEELRGLIREYIREEAAYREAVATGLDRDDTIVRKRLRQKLEFISDDVAGRVEPTDQELQGFLQSHPALFQTDSTYTFRQVYLDPQKHGQALQGESQRILTQLRASGDKADSDTVGDPFLLQTRLQRVNTAEVKQIFGDEFASRLARLKPGVWEGPLHSGYGVHLVLVTQRDDSRLPPLAEIRGEVRREWLNFKRTEATDKFYEALLKRYTIRIEPLEEQKIAQVH